MANGIGNNESKKQLTNQVKIKSPAEKDEKSRVTVSSFADTLSKGITGFKGIATEDQLKGQLRNGEYVTIKVSDKPIEIKSEDKKEQKGTGRGD